MFKEYDQYDAVGLAQLVRNGEVTPEQLLEEAIARVEQRDPALNAVVNKLYDHAREAIRAGLPDGPLRGVPFLLKDLHALCSGAVTSNGSRFFKDNLADHDTELVVALQAGRAGHLRQDQHAGVRLDHHHRAGSVRSDAKPVESRLTRRAARAAARPRQWRQGLRRPPTRPTAAARSAFLLPAAGCSDSNPRAGATRRGPTAARAGPG